jgi:polyisoprenoid-binding protein YceI
MKNTWSPFPKATFQGKILGASPNADGEQKVKAVGKLSMHGVTKDVEIPGTLERVNGKVQMKSKFKVRLADYNIKIPTLVWQNIAEEVEIKIDIVYKPV